MPESWRFNVIEDVFNTADKMKLTTRVPSTIPEGQLILAQFIPKVKVSGMFFHHFKVQLVGAYSGNLFRLQVSGDTGHARSVVFKL